MDSINNSSNQQQNERENDDTASLQPRTGSTEGGPPRYAPIDDEEEQEELVEVQALDDDGSLLLPSQQAQGNTSAGNALPLQVTKSFMPSNPAFDWSTSFHDLIDKIKRMRRERETNSTNLLDIYQQLANLASDFSNAAEIYGRIIIEEAELHEDFKTIKSLGKEDIAGYAGGMKFVSHGILFKFAHHMEEVYGNEDNANKATSHELRSCATIAGLALGADDIDVYPPLMAVVDFRGFRLLAVSVLPLFGERTLRYGCCNASHDHPTIHRENPDVNKMIARIASKLKLKRHKAFDGKEIDIGTDCEGHVSGDEAAVPIPGQNAPKRLYLVDLARLFPPECPAYVLNDFFKNQEVYDFPERYVMQEQGSKQRHDLGAKHLYRQLRPSFLAKYKIPLSSDACSQFGSNDRNIHDKEVAIATVKLKSEFIDKCCANLLDSPQDAAGYPDEYSLTEFLHAEGINMRYLYLLYCQIPNDSVWKGVVLVEMVARAFKTFLRRKWREKVKSKRGRPSDDVCHNVAIEEINNLMMRSSDDGNSWQEKYRHKHLEKYIFQWWEILAKHVEEKFGKDANGMYTVIGGGVNSMAEALGSANANQRSSISSLRIPKPADPNPTQFFQKLQRGVVAGYSQRANFMPKEKKTDASGVNVGGKRRSPGDTQGYLPPVASTSASSSSQAPTSKARSDGSISGDPNPPSDPNVLDPQTLYRNINRKTLLKRICQMLGFEFHSSVDLDKVAINSEYQLQSKDMRRVGPMVRHLEIIDYALAKVSEIKALKNIECFDMGIGFLETALKSMKGYRDRQPVNEWMMRDLGTIMFELGLRTPPEESERALKLMNNAEKCIHHLMSGDSIPRPEKAFRSVSVGIQHANETLALAKRFARCEQRIILDGYERVYGLSLSESQKTIAIGSSEERETGVIALCNPATGKTIWKAPHQSWVRTALIHDASQSVFIGENDSGDVTARSLADGSFLRKYSVPIDKRMDLLQFETKHFYKMMIDDKQELPNLPKKVLGIAVLKGKLYAGCYDGGIYFWDIADSDPANCLGCLQGHQGSVISLTVDDTETMLVSTSSDHTAILWDLASGKPKKNFGEVGHKDELSDMTKLGTGHTDQVTSCAICPNFEDAQSTSENRTICTTSFDQTCRIWSTDSDHCIRVLSGHTSGVWDVCFLSSSIIATAAGDYTVRVWSLSHEKCIRMLTGHKEGLYRVKYVQSDACLYTTSSDGTLREWKLVDLVDSEEGNGVAELEEGVAGVSLSMNSSMDDSIGSI